MLGEYAAHFGTAGYADGGSCKVCLGRAAYRLPDSDCPVCSRYLSCLTAGDSVMSANSVVELLRAVSDWPGYAEPPQSRSVVLPMPVIRENLYDFDEDADEADEDGWDDEDWDDDEDEWDDDEDDEDEDDEDEEEDWEDYEEDTGN